MSAHLRSGYHFQPIEALPEPPAEWRALDHAVARWVVAHGGALQTAAAAGWASWAEGSGHTAIPLRRDDGTAGTADRGHWPALSLRDLEALKVDPLVSCPVPGEQVLAPFVLDRDHFFLRRSYIAECAVAAHVRTRVAATDAASTVTDADLDVLFAGDADVRVQLQREAVRRVVGRRFFVLTGGPGTGKTTTVLRMLTMLACDRARRGLPEPAIRAAAPTGKAAQRLAESLREGAARFSESLGSVRDSSREDWAAHLACAVRAEASTLHRLLGSRGQSGFSRSAGSPVPADIVVVDEASMIDLALLRALLEALREDTVLILVGDADQLTSVGAGSALLDIASALEGWRATDTAAAPPLVRLTHSFRSDAVLVPINEAVRAGDPVALNTAFVAAGERFEHRRVETASDCQQALEAWAARMHRCLAAAGAFDPVPPERTDLVAKALDGLRHCQLLCALREGEFGAQDAARQLERSLRERMPGDWPDEWYPGRAVMITRNDYTTGLFNGDIGICLQEKDGRLAVWFEIASDPERSNAQPVSGTHRRFVRFAPGNLPDHRSAAAITIHKSQGSEYDHAAVLLPPDASHQILCRQLVYTALSRAKRSTELWATQESLHRCIEQKVSRHGALAARVAAADNSGTV